MADPDDDKLWKDDKLWEVRSRGLNYLLIAHAAGLVACLTALKDYQASPQLKGVGTFVWLFGLGFMSAVLAMAVLVPVRQGELLQGRDSIHGRGT
jgi:hypothetical protein